MLHEHFFHHTRPCSRLSGRHDAALWRGQLASCLINGKPGVAIVLLEHVGEGKIGVMPLFVAITPEMDIAFEGEVGGGSGEGGGPRRALRMPRT